jgi:dTDP-4-dehydrorhamnose 3,5-epimerase
MLYIPVGFAHAYYALTDIVVHYKLSAEYSPTDEGYIVWNDPEISVEWPVACPLLSDKDCMNPLFRDAINSFA